MAEGRQKQIAQSFEKTTLRIRLSDILPLRDVTDKVRKSSKYNQIYASIREVGIIEPPVVIRDKDDANLYHLLDGHLRMDILKANNASEVVCLVATEDEAFTYNKRINKLATIQEHKMILNAIQKGVPEERLSKALNINIHSIRKKRDLLKGICEEVADLLKDKQVPMHTFRQLRYMKPVRQIAAAQLMIAMNKFTANYAMSLVAASSDEELVDPERKKIGGLSADKRALMEQESAKLDAEISEIEKSYGADHLDLVLAIGYVTKLLGNVRVVRHMAKHHPDILSEFQKIAELEIAA